MNSWLPAVSNRVWPQSARTALTIRPSWPGGDGLAVGRHQHAGHETERPEALGHDVRLHVAVVVLARPHVTALPLQRGGDHVVDEAVLVGEPGRLELGGELVVEHLLEQVLELA